VGIEQLRSGQTVTPRTPDDRPRVAGFADCRRRVLRFLKQMPSRSRLYKPRAKFADVMAMSWRDFERLIGEAFRRRGCTLTGFGGGGPNGSVDLALIKNGHKFLVQCKHWRERKVGVSVVRELNGVLVAMGADKAFVVTGGEFTREAREFAEKSEVELIDGKSLQELIAAVDSHSLDRRREILKIA
jgi:HJR/Mrr/RecB family endonuclease